MKMLKTITISIIILSNIACANTNIEQVQKIVSSERQEYHQYGYAVDIHRNYAIITARLDTNDRTREHIHHAAGAAYVYKYDSTLKKWSETQKLVASDRKAFAVFGAAVSMNDQYAIIGAPQEYMDENGGDSLFNAGAAYIFKYDKSSENWLQHQKIVASDRGKDDSYGTKVLIDGENIFIAAAREGRVEGSPESKGNAGAIYTYKYDNISEEWVEVQKITASDRKISDYFGQGFAKYGDYLMVSSQKEGVPISDTDSLYKSGEVYVFKYNEDTNDWLEVQKISEEVSQRFASFGRGISISRNYAAFGSRSEHIEIEGNDTIRKTGAVYIYKHNEDSENWEIYQKIVSKDKNNWSGFGEEIVMDKNRMIIGAQGTFTFSKNGEEQDDAGAAIYYEFDEDREKWVEVQKFASTDLEGGDYFGREFALDGDNIVVGTWTEDEDVEGLDSIYWAGSAYIFKIDSKSTEVEKGSLEGVKDRLSIAPNPNNGEVSIKINKRGIREVYIVGTNGERVKTIAEGNIQKEFEYSINDANLRNGIYYVVAEDETGMIIKKMVVLK